MVTDISESVLHFAQKGLYSWRKAENIPLIYREFCVSLSTTDSGSVLHASSMTTQDWKISDELRERVFSINLI